VENLVAAIVIGYGLCSSTWSDQFALGDDVFQDYWSNVAWHRGSLWFRGRTNQARSTGDNLHSDCPVVKSEFRLQTQSGEHLWEVQHLATASRAQDSIAVGD
jgi:hypothetical protein